MVEAAGVELISMLTERKLLIRGSSTTAKKALLPDPLYVYCTKILFGWSRADTTQRLQVSHRLARTDREKVPSFLRYREPRPFDFFGMPTYRVVTTPATRNSFEARVNSHRRKSARSEAHSRQVVERRSKLGCIVWIVAAPTTARAEF